MSINSSSITLQQFCKRYMLLNEFSNSLVEGNFKTYINVLNTAMTINYKRTKKWAQSLVCSDVISNIYIIMYKRGISDNVIEKTCKTAAILYTESLNILEYCLEDIKLKHIIDIKKIVYMKTVGKLLISDDIPKKQKQKQKLYNDGRKETNNNVYNIIKMSKVVVQSILIHFFENKEEYNISTDISIFIEMYLNTLFHLIVLNCKYYVHNSILELHGCVSTLNVTKSSPKDLKYLLVTFIIQSLIFKYIFEQTRNYEISLICYKSLNLDVPLNDLNDSILCVTCIDEIKTHPIYQDIINMLV